MFVLSMTTRKERHMRLRTACLLALVAVTASPVAALSDTRAGAASSSRVEAACTASAPVWIDDRERGLCKTIHVAQTPRQTCIKTCQDAYNGGEPLQTCIRQCPAE
jgi:hypothetical protein